MPGNRLFRNEERLSDTYLAARTQRRNSKKELETVLQGRLFATLNNKEQIKYCRIKKKLAEQYWQCFEIATTEHYYKLAAQDFVKAHFMNYEKAVRLFRKKENQSVLDSILIPDPFYQSICAQLGLGVPQDHKKAVAGYKVAAEQGNSRAQFYLGICYSEAFGVEKNEAEALRWYELAAEQGNSCAQNNFGLCYGNGNGVVKDAFEAARWYRLAAEQGNSYAQNNLGSLYENGNGVVKDAFEAARWYRLAAEQGNSYAQNNLGSLYENGDGVVKDAFEAARWYRLAAEQGNCDAQNNLGICYEKGVGVAEDPFEAARWYRLAAEQGYALAQHNLGDCYKYGDGVVEDPFEAVRWYQLAAEQEFTTALDALISIKTPFAFYALALIKQNFSEALKLALKHDELLKELLTRGLEKIIKAKGGLECLRVFFMNPENQSTSSNSALIDVLIALNLKLRQSAGAVDEAAAAIETLLLSLINLADADAHQIKPLVFFLSGVYLDNSSETAVKALICLWHRAQTIEFQITDSDILKLFAQIVVKHYLKDKYLFNHWAEINPENVSLLVLTCETKSALRDVYLQLLSKSLLIPLNTKETPRNLIPKLKACLSDPLTNWGSKTVPPFIASVSKFLCELDNAFEPRVEQLDLLLDKLATAAKKFLDLANPHSLFISSEEDRKLAELLMTYNSKGLVDWIQTHQSIELCNSAAQSLLEDKGPT